MDQLVAGIIIGGSLTFFGFLGCYFFVNWVKEKKAQIREIKFELERYSMMRDDWNEFQYWKREQKEKK
jgi:hypothetical protein